MRRVLLLVGIGFLLVGACASAATARVGAVLQIRLVPEYPQPGTTATLVIRGTTAKTGMVLVLAVTAPSCPARIPPGAHFLVPPNPLWTGGISSDLRLRVDETAKRYCVYLVPAKQDAYGHTSYKATAPPLGTAEVTVGDTPRLAGGGAFGSGTSDNTSLQLIVAPNGSTITKILVTCGGNPLRPPALGKALIAKHFTASVSLPLTSRIRWAGLVLPDNSTNYDAPIPARWNGRVRYSLDASVRTVDGGYPGSRGQVSCPAQASPARRYVATAEPPLIREHSRGVAQPSIHPLAYGAPSAEPPGVTRANVGISRSYCVRCQAGACS